MTPVIKMNRSKELHVNINYIQNVTGQTQCVPYKMNLVL